MIWCFFAGRGHRRRTSCCIKFFADASVWIWFGHAGRNRFATERDEHRRIVRLIAERTWFAVFDPEISPILFDLEREWRSGHCDVASEVFCYIETDLTRAR